MRQIKRIADGRLNAHLTQLPIADTLNEASIDHTKNLARYIFGNAPVFLHRRIPLVWFFSVVPAADDVEQPLRDAGHASTFRFDGLSMAVKMDMSVLRSTMGRKRPAQNGNSHISRDQRQR